MLDCGWASVGVTKGLVCLSAGVLDCRYARLWVFYRVGVSELVFVEC